MRTKLRGKVTLLFMTCAVLLAVPAIALADNIVNSLDPTIDAVAETMPLNQNGANGTTTLYVDPTNGDGKNGCNFGGTTGTLQLAISSSDTSVATVSPSSVTFSGCGQTHTLTVTPHNAGTANINVTQTSNTTGATFALAPAQFKVVVSPPPNTPPTVTVAGVTGGASYNKGSVPNATCQVTDAEDGNSSFAATLSPVTGPFASDGIGSQTASCSYTDAGGATAAASLSYSIVDPSGPVITKVVTPASPDGNNGWYKSDVKVVWTVSDPQSPNSLQKTGCVDQNITSDQPETTYSCSATSAGGPAGPESVTIKRDATAPNFNCGTADADWHADDVNIACTASDGGSGLANAGDASFNLSTSVANGVENSNASTGSRTVLDAAGNSATAGPIAGNKVDKKAPSFNCDSADAVWHATNQTFSCTANDGGSGLTPNSDANFSLSTTVTAGNETNNASTGTKTLTDAVGNTVTAPAITGVKVDMKAPVLTDEGPTPTNPDGTNGWYKSAVTNSFKATDGGSGFAPNGDLTKSFTESSGTNEGAAVKIPSGAVSDAVGNSAASIDSAAFKIDLSNPTNVTFVGGPAAGVEYFFGDTPDKPSCTADDAVSGFASCEVTGYSTAVGTHTMTATATDNAGRTATATRSYTVKAWTFNGFYQPVDMNGVYNTVKGGSTVPLKFELFKGATELTSTSYIIQPLQTQKINCTSGVTEDTIELLATGGTSLRYDSTGGQYIYNWKTPTGAGSCYKVTVSATDGSSITAYFKLK